ncbi:hypothetical protein [Micromonospora sediminicola]|uniref:hypothetical protein n=1 Tax=Micromonospora sediminicola TaxID=946078 RepID=UPI003789A612
MSDVGSARVEVTGDVRNFARQTERDLDRALSRIKAPTVKVGVDVDKDKAGKSFTELGTSAVKSITGIIGNGLSGLGTVLGPVLGVAGAAIGGTLATAMVAVILPTLAAAFTSLAGIGLGAGLLGLGAFALRDVKEFRTALEGVGKTLNDVARRAARPLLKPLVTAMRDLTKLAKSLVPDFRAIFSALAPVIPLLTEGLGGFAKNVVAGLRDSMPGITAAFSAFADVLPTLGRWLGDFFRAIFENEGVIRNATNALLLLVGSPLKLLGPLISGLTVLFGALTNAVKLGADQFGPIRDALLGFVDGGTGALERLRTAWGPLGEAIQGVWDKLKAFAGETDSAQLPVKFAALVQSIKDAWGPLKEFLGVVWEEALAFVQRVWDDYFIPWWEETAKPALTSALKELFRTAWDAAKSMVSAKLAELRTDAEGKMRALPGAIGAALAALAGIVGRAFTSAALAAISGAARIVSGALEKIRALPGQARSALGGVRSAVTGAFSGAGSWLADAGRRIIDGLISGLRSGFDRVRSTLGSLTSMLPDWKGPAEVDRKILEASGEMVMAGFDRGLRSRFTDIQKTLGDLTGDLPAWSGGRPRGGDGASAGRSFSIGELHVHVSGATGREAGEEAAEAVLERLGAATLAR